MSAGQESGSPIRENRTLLPAPLPPDEARGTLAAAAGVSTVGLRPPFDTPAAAFSSCLSRHSHLDCRARPRRVPRLDPRFRGDDTCWLGRLRCSTCSEASPKTMFVRELMPQDRKIEIEQLSSE